MGLGILCPGQGGQSSDMFQRLRDFGTAPADIEDVAAAVSISPQALLNEPIAADLYVNTVAQPLLAGYMCAAWRTLSPALPAPVAIAGYSLGEVVAYGVAGAIDVAPLMELVKRRAELMSAAAPEIHGMMAVNSIKPSEVAHLLQAADIAIAIENGPDHFVFGGPLTEIEKAEAAGLSIGLDHIRRLPVDVASHTRFMAAAVAPFRDVLVNAQTRNPDVRVINGIGADSVITRDGMIETLPPQIAQKIRWADCLTQMKAVGVTALLELGPGRALTKMCADVVPDMPVRPLEDFRSAAGVAKWVERYLN